MQTGGGNTELANQWFWTFELNFTNLLFVDSLRIECFLMSLFAELIGPILQRLKLDGLCRFPLSFLSLCSVQRRNARSIDAFLNQPHIWFICSLSAQARNRCQLQKGCTGREWHVSFFTPWSVLHTVTEKAAVPYRCAVLEPDKKWDIYWTICIFSPARRALDVFVRVFPILMFTASNTSKFCVTRRFTVHGCTVKRVRAGTHSTF